MEDKELEKYIFDPKNPKGCKVYNLLLHIVKREKNAVFLSPHYIFHIFEKEFKKYENIIKESLWDIPSNFNELTTFEKYNLFFSQYSKLELFEKVGEFTFNDNLLTKVFNNFFKNFDYEFNSKIKFNFNDYDYFTDKLYLNSVYSIKINNLNIVIFIDKSHFGLYDISPSVSSIFITTLEEYKNLENYKKRYFIDKNFQPLLLKDIKDVFLLLDVLYRDMQQEEQKDLETENKTEEEITYLKEIEIKKYFSLQNVTLKDLEDKKEIYIVGENGNGKTLFLQSIILALKEKQEDGVVFNFIQKEKNNIDIKAIDSKDESYEFSLKEEEINSYKNIFAYGVNRNLNDSDKKDELGYLTLFSESEYLNNPIKWLQYLDYKKLKDDESSSISLELAKEFLRDILDKNVEIEVTPDEVIFTERGTKVNFSELSDGYKSVIIWVSDLIERLSKNQPTVTTLRDFRGIVLVDEIDLHLHPKWKYSIVKRLRSWLPNIQFIFTTHSPIILLGASEEATFYKIYKEDGISKISQPLKSIQNMMANTLITSPLVNLESARAENSDGDIDTSDDFLYSKIHQKIAEKIVNDSSITEDDILDMIDKELQLFEEENEKSN